jgi:hypothetical protein
MRQMTEGEYNAISAFIAWLNTPTERHITSLREPDEVLAHYLADTGKAIRPEAPAQFTVTFPAMPEAWVKEFADRIYQEVKAALYPAPVTSKP